MQAMNPVKTPRIDNRFLDQRLIRTFAIGLICHVIDASCDQAEHLSAQRQVTLFSTVGAPCSEHRFAISLHLQILILAFVLPSDRHFLSNWQIALAHDIIEMMQANHRYLASTCVTWLHDEALCRLRGPGSKP